MNKKRGLKMADCDPSEELKKLAESMEVAFFFLFFNHKKGRF